MGTVDTATDTATDAVSDAAPGPPEVRRLVLLRHGRTAWNHEGRAQGHTDIELDEVGHAQARAAADAVAALRPAAIWCSDLRRAHRTAAYVAEAAGLPVRPDARLRERSIGVWEGLTRQEFAERHPESFAAWRAARGRWEVVPGGESDEAVAARMLDALGELLDTVPAGATALAVAHGACLKLVAARLLGLGPDHDHVLGGLDNCAWVVLDTARLDGVLRARLLAWNRVAATPGFASAGAGG